MSPCWRSCRSPEPNAVICSVALALTARLGTAQTPVPAVYVPALASRRHRTCSRLAAGPSPGCSVAGAGPLLVAVRVKITLLPMTGFGVFAVFVTAMSADCAGVTVAVAVLFAGFGSVTPTAVIEAVLTTGLVVLTVAVTCSVAVRPAPLPASVPTAHVPVAALYVP